MDLEKLTKELNDLQAFRSRHMGATTVMLNAVKLARQEADEQADNLLAAMIDGNLTAAIGASRQLKDAATSLHEAGVALVSLLAVLPIIADAPAYEPVDELEQPPVDDGGDGSDDELPGLE